jgi:hypothetical protein
MLSGDVWIAMVHVAAVPVIAQFKAWVTMPSPVSEIGKNAPIVVPDTGARNSVGFVGSAAPAPRLVSTNEELKAQLVRFDKVESVQFVAATV